MKSLLKYIVMAAVAIVALSCSKDSYETPDDYARGMSTSNTDVSTTFAVNRVVTFMDLSRMVESREWIVGEGVELYESDATSQKIYAKFVSEGYDQTVTLRVVLSQPDLEVVAQNEAYYASGDYDLIVDPQLYEEVYSYTVLGSVSANILSEPIGDNVSGGIQDAMLFDEVGFSYADHTVYIEKGDMVKFTASCTGLPTTYAWTFAGASTESYDTEECYVTYNNVGIYNVTLEAKRTSPASTATRTLTAFVVVTDPITEDDDE